MSEKIHILNGSSVGIFQGDNIIVDDEFQPDEGKVDCSDPSEMTEYTVERFIDDTNSIDESQEEPVVYEAGVIDPDNSQFWFFNTDSTEGDQADQGQSDELMDNNDQIIIEQSLIISNFDIDPVQHSSKMIHIDTKSDLSKPAVSGLNVAGVSANFVKKPDMQTVFLCPEKHCKLKLPSRSTLLTHVKMCHKETDVDVEQGDGFLSDDNILPDADGGDTMTEDSDLEKTDSEDTTFSSVKKSLII